MSALARTRSEPLSGWRRPNAAPATPATPAPSRPRVRLLAFLALGLYGVLRWSAMLTPRPTWRLLGLLALAGVAVGPLGAVFRRRRTARAAAVLGAGALLVAALPLAGVPVALVMHGHLHAIASGISQGLGALPRLTVPYSGIDAWARIVVLLGAAVLVLDAGILLAFAPHSLGDARRAAAALPLIALAVVPSTLIEPSMPYLHGLVLLALVAALVWGERLNRRGLRVAVLAIAAAGGLAIVAAPAIENHNHPWVDYQALAGAFSTSGAETFDWSQHYGPIAWPRTGREILDVQARRADYWKAENLDIFDGTRWTQGPVETGDLLPPAAPSALARWTQALRVRIRAMQTHDVISAGSAAAPEHVPQAVLQGASPGTWRTAVNLGPGDAYGVSTYSPRPSEAQLASAGASPTDLLAGYRTITLGTSAAAPYAPPEIRFAPFHSGAGAQSSGASRPAAISALIAGSPYAGTYALARGLARRARTPFGLVQLVMAYLGRGFTYSESPPARSYPLESFLLRDKLGYCQQFSGAMALLLRMGGVPARVSAGFTSGTYDPSSHQWLVRDLDAHSWVEVWFRSYGWVRFDPTPAAAPELGGRSTAPRPAAAPVRAASAVHAGGRAQAPAAAALNPRHGAGGSGLSPAVGLILLIGCIAIIAMLSRRRSSRIPENLVRELERALRRSGRPLRPGSTLSQLERRWRSSPDAAGYVRALVLARYGGIAAAPTPAQRRALRARLAEGLGLGRRLRALWALPPRL